MLDIPVVLSCPSIAIVPTSHGQPKNPTAAQNQVVEMESVCNHTKIGLGGRG
jgi:hypothetical protein